MTGTVAEYTVSEKILLAAHQLDKQGQSPFSAEALIIASWQAYPRTFGLKGYTDQYPDSNKVLSSIMGERGLAKRGWLIKMGQKLYSLTREGRRTLALLLKEEAPPETELSDVLKLGRDKEKFLLNLFSSTSYRKFEDNQKNDLTFADACRFWDISQNVKGEQVDEKLTAVTELLKEMDRELSQQNAVLSNGRVVTAGDLRVLNNIHRHMEDRFDRLLTLLRSRR